MANTRDNLTAFQSAYARLNAAQKQAVDTIEGPVMVIAGPGTGKTQILTLRIAKILVETQVDPENILALTFTNSGVRAMRERLRSYIGDDAYRVGIYTFHSFAEHILQAYRSYFPAREFATVISDLEKAKILERILEQHDFSELVSAYDRFSSLKQVMDAIGDIKQEGLQPEQFEALIPQWEKEQMEDETMFYKRATGSYKAGDRKPTEAKKVAKRVAKAREIATVFKAYQAALQKENRYDFSDMILSVLKELEGNEDLKLDLQERYHYVLVDEHQDTNEGQSRLIELLTDAAHLDGRPNLFTVGDEKQSIYRFQGASDAAFRHFQSHYNDVTVIELSENYRSGTPILTAAHELITHSLPDAKALNSTMVDQAAVTVREFSDYKFELLFVVNDIKTKLASGTVPDEIAVIYRSNKHLAEIKTLFQEYGIPYHVRSRDTLLDDPLIAMLITLFRVVADPYDDHSLGTVLFATWLSLDALTVANTLRRYRRLRRDESGIEGLIDLLQTEETYRTCTEMITSLKQYEVNHQFTETFKAVLHESGFLAHVLALPDSQSALRKIEALFNEVRQQAERTPHYGINDFVSFIDATLAYNLSIEVTATRVGAGVQCMTAHGSKGLEFEHVYLINTARSNWEKNRGFPSIALPLQRYQGELDDERRLFYVALTRAKRQLAISSSAQDWSGKALEPSQFISELGEEMVTREDTETFEAEQSAALVTFFSTARTNASVFDTEYLRERFLEENLSVTALNNFIDCPLKYLFRNLIQLPDVYTPALRYGDTVHRALETFFTESAREKQILPKQSLLQAYEQAMKTAGFYGAAFDDFLQKGRRALGMYYDYYHADWSTNIVLEEYIRRSIQIKEVALTLSGKIDKLEFLDTLGSGRVRVIDYKTGKTFSEKSTKAQKQALERQIRFYHLLLAEYKGGDITVAEALLDFVEPSTDNEFEQKTLVVEASDLQALQDEIAGMVDAVMSGAFIEQGCGKKDCDACDLWQQINR